MGVKTLNRQITKQYSLVASDDKYFLSNYYNDGVGYGKQIYVTTVDVIGGIEYIQPYILTLSSLIEAKKFISEAAPIDVRVYSNNIEITDNEEKAKIFANLAITEIKTDNSKSMKKLSTKDLKNTQEEDALKSKLNSILGQVVRNVSGLSLSECKKLQNKLAATE